MSTSSDAAVCCESIWQVASHVSVPRDTLIFMEEMDLILAQNWENIENVSICTCVSSISSYLRTQNGGLMSSRRIGQVSLA